MKKLIALLAILATASVASADNHGNFTATGEFRMRYKYDQNVTGNKDTEPTSKDAASHRFKIGGMFKSSEKVSANFTLLNNATWGSAKGTAKHTGAGNAADTLLVQQVYSTWMVDDTFSIKMGRWSHEIADGSLVGINDYQSTPFSFEGILGTYSQESFTGELWLVRLAEYDTQSTDSNTDQDPEMNLLGLNFDFKSLPEFLSMANVHVLYIDQDVQFGANNATVTANGQAVTRYGVALGGETAGLDYKVNYEAETGENKNGAAGGAVTTQDVATNMYQVELGYSLPEVMNSRFYVLYHADSGTGTGTNPKDETYNPLFYEQHYNAGLMDIVAWGNLTYISLGYTLEPMEDTMVGIHYHMFSKTEKNTATTAGTYGSSILATQSTDDDKIGDEIDLVATKKYTSNFSMTTRLGMFMPGDVIKNGGGVGSGPSDTYTQFFVQAKMKF